MSQLEQFINALNKIQSEAIKSNEALKYEKTSVFYLMVKVGHF